MLVAMTSVTERFFATSREPVVTSWMSGIAPEYRSVLIIPDAEMPAGLA